MQTPTAPGLQRKLKPAVPSASYVGTFADYFVSRYGFQPETPVIAFTEYEPAVSLDDARAHGWEPVPGLPHPPEAA